MSELPPGWTETTIGEVAETKLGKMLSAKSKVGANPRPYLRNKNVQWGRIDVDDLLRMDFSDEEFELFRVLPADLLVCEGGEVGRAAIWRDSTREIAFQKALHRLRPLAEVQAEFLLYLLMWFSESNAFDRFVTGSTIKHLPQEDLRRLPLPLPPLAEQRRIVAAIEEQFSRLDAAERSVHDAGKRLALLRARTYSQAVAAGEERVLETLLDGIEAGKSFKCDGQPAKEHEWGVIKVSAMTWGSFDASQNKTVTEPRRVDPRWEVRPGDLLLSRANTSELVGAAVLVGECRPKLLLSDKSMRLLVKPGVEKAWLRAALGSREIRSQMSDAATGTSDSMRNISQQKVKELRLRVPNVEEQRRIVAEVEQQLSLIDSLRAAVESAQKRSAALRRAILERAFRGELVPQDPDDEPASVLLERIRAERATAPRPSRRRATMEAS